MPAKLITKQEALRAAYYISAISHGAGGMTQRPLPGSAKTSFDEEWSGKWRTTKYIVEGPGFKVSASRTKHADGRIRDAHEQVEGALYLACYVLEQCSHLPEIAQLIDKWQSGLRDHATVRRTLEPAARSALRCFAAEEPQHDRLRAVWNAKLVHKMAA